MANYTVRGINPEGKRVAVKVRAESEQAVRNGLAKKGWQVEQVEHDDAAASASPPPAQQDSAFPDLAAGSSAGGSGFPDVTAGAGDRGSAFPSTAAPVDTSNPYASPTAASAPPSYGAERRQRIQYAGFWLRVVASIVDGILCQVIGFAVGFTLGLMMALSGIQDQEMLAAVGYVLGIVVQWLYFTLTESSEWQATPGKKMIGLKVTDMQGRPIGFGRANGRYWGKILSAVPLGIGFIMAGFTEKKQALHDMLAGTLVIKSN